MAVNTAQVNNITGDKTSNFVQLIVEYICKDAPTMDIIANNAIGARIIFSALDILGCVFESATVIVIRPLRFFCIVLIPVGSVFVFVFIIFRIVHFQFELIFLIVNRV